MNLSKPKLWIILLAALALILALIVVGGWVFLNSMFGTNLVMTLPRDIVHRVILAGTTEDGKPVMFSANIHEKFVRSRSDMKLIKAGKPVEDLTLWARYTDMEGFTRETRDEFLKSTTDRAIYISVVYARTASMKNTARWHFEFDGIDPERTPKKAVPGTQVRQFLYEHKRHKELAFFEFEGSDGALVYLSCHLKGCSVFRNWQQFQVHYFFRRSWFQDVESIDAMVLRLLRSIELRPI